MDVVALALWDNMFRGVFFLLTDPLQYGCISQARKLILDAFFGNKRVMAHIGEAQKQKQNE